MYNVYIIGAGSKGALSDAPGSGNERKYLSYAHAVTDHPAFKLVGFGDILPEMREGAERIWHSENSNTLDIVVISTPDDSHYEYLKSVVDIGLGMVICEKPLCDNSAHAREIVDLFNKHNVPLMVDYTRRFIPRFREYRTIIQRGDYGKFVTGYLYFNRGWPHAASHFVDLCLWYGVELDKIQFIHPPVENFQWLFQWALIFERGVISENYGMLSQGYKVDPAFDRHLYLVMDSAYQYLERNTNHLFCTGEEALEAIVQTERMQRKWEEL